MFKYFWEYKEFAFSGEGWDTNLGYGIWREKWLRRIGPRALLHCLYIPKDKR